MAVSLPRMSLSGVFGACAGLLILAASVSPSASPQSASASKRPGQAPQSVGAVGPGLAQQQDVVTKYCATCHNERLKSGDLVLDPAALGDVPAHAAQWEKVIRKLNA